LPATKSTGFTDHPIFQARGLFVPGNEAAGSIYIIFVTCG
jgi:hypothetical protein